MSQLSDYVEQVGDLLDGSQSTELPKLLAKARNKFMALYRDEDNMDMEGLSDEFYRYLTKYFLTTENLPKMVRGNSSFCWVPLPDHLQTPEVVKGLLDAMENGFGGNYGLGLQHISAKNITPEIIDHLISLTDDPEDAIQEILDRDDLSPDTVSYAKSKITDHEVSESLSRIKKMANYLLP